MSSRKKTDSRQKSTHDADVIVIGGGHAGLTLSCLLGTHGIRTICIDRVPYDTSIMPAFDGRTTAISFGSRKVIEAAKAWQNLDQYACPINTIQILDGDSPVLLEFDSTEVGGNTFGWILENRLIRQALFERIQELDCASYIAPCLVEDFTVTDEIATVHTKDGKEFTAPLIIGADGRGSFTREWMDIGTRDWSYKQQAVVCTAEHEHPHNQIAVEHFRSEGPFAILPMTDAPDGTHRSSVVWTEHGKGKDSALNYDIDTFNAALTARFPDSYGTVKLTGKRFAFPLGLVHAHKYTAPRMALVADAAHGIHPIAGQGLNMGLRDIAVLADLIVAAHKAGADIGGDELLSQYDLRRKADNVGMAAATDGLNRLFSNNLPPLSALRKIGLSAVSKLPPAKQFFMKQAMGSAGLLPGLIKDADCA